MYIKNFLNVKRDIESLTPEKNTVKNEIDAQFSKISRPLGNIAISHRLKNLSKTLWNV